MRVIDKKRYEIEILKLIKIFTRQELNKIEGI